MSRFLALVLLTAAAAAQPADLRVAVSESPPVSTRSGEVWGGVGPSLLEDISQSGRRVTFVEVARDSLIAAVVSGRVDAAIAPVTAQSEDEIDYAPPFYATPLGIARNETNGVLEVARRLFTPTFFKIIAGLMALLFVIGSLIWLVERRTDQDDFREGAIGLWDGFWWSGVTMTTIGYGDTVPKTPGGRTIALSWMLLSMGVTAALTTAMVSALGLESQDRARPDQLEGRVGAVGGTIVVDMLREMDVTATPFEDVRSGLEAVVADSLDAFVGAAPALRAEAPDGLEVATTDVAFDRWGLALPDESPIREEIARAIIDRIMSADWPEVVRRNTE